MRTQGYCADIDTPLQEVVAMMQCGDCSGIVLVEGGRPVGIVTERDIVDVLAKQLSSPVAGELYVRDFMATPPICVNQTADFYQAIVITQSHKIRHLPVVDDDYQLVGFITQTDIARTHYEAIEQQREVIEAQIQQRTRELVEANEELKALSLTDSLLKVGNRRAMEVDLHYTHDNSLRYNQPYSVALLDVDYFKRYNDHYGHQAGDEALLAVVEEIQSCMRSGDRLYRYGGEELLLLLPGMSMDGAPQVLERIVESVSRRAIPHRQSAHGVVTLSAGVAGVDRCQQGGRQVDQPECPPAGWQGLVEEADQRLYRAKGCGRNSVHWR